jgi:uncharacterized membrane protein
MTSTQKAILTAAIVGGVCGIAGAAFYVAWRARRKRAEERVSSVVRQLEKVADRIQGGLVFGAAPRTTDARGIVVNDPRSS